MPRSVEEIESDLAAAELEDKGEAADQVDEGNDDGEADEGEQDPPGFMSHEEWIAAGKDPDDYKGKNAYNAEYERIQEVKSLKKGQREIQETMKSVVSAAEQVRQNDALKHKADLEVKLAQQKTDMDVDGALETKAEIDAIDTKPAAPTQNPLIDDFVADNPLIDPDSSQYNSEFSDDMTAFYNASIDALGGQTRQISDAQIAKCLKRALASAKEFNPDLFKSARNERGGANRGGKQKQSGKQGSLSDYKIDDQGDVKNLGAANDMYEMIKKQSPERAEIFKANILAGN